MIKAYLESIAFNSGASVRSGNARLVVMPGMHRRLLNGDSCMRREPRVRICSLYTPCTVGRADERRGQSRPAAKYPGAGQPVDYEKLARPRACRGSGGRVGHDHPTRRKFALRVRHSRCCVCLIARFPPFAISPTSPGWIPFHEPPANRQVARTVAGFAVADKCGDAQKMTVGKRTRGVPLNCVDRHTRKG